MGNRFEATSNRKRNPVMLSRMLAGLFIVVLVGAARPASQGHVGADPISGTWDVMFQVEGHPTAATLELRLKRHTVTGKVSSAHTGPGRVTDGTWADNRLAFTAVFEQHGPIAMTASLQEGRLVGEFRTEGFVAKWEAKRR
jgi:hypothetical protein